MRGSSPDGSHLVEDDVRSGFRGLERSLAAGKARPDDVYGVQVLIVRVRTIPCTRRRSRATYLRSHLRLQTPGSTRGCGASGCQFLAQLDRAAPLCSVLRSLNARPEPRATVRLAASRD